MAKAKAEGDVAKKKGKKPVIIAVVVMLAAGGFFGMKAGGGSGKVEPKVELGEILPLGEFLVNLSDGRTFLKTEISVHIAKGKSIVEGEGHGEGKIEPPAPIRDAVVAVLSAQDLKTVSSPEGKVALKEALAKAINEAAPKDHDDAKHKPAKAEGEGKEKVKVVDATWDSQSGPVLKVYFTNFATQQ